MFNSGIRAEELLNICMGNLNNFDLNNIYVSSKNLSMLSNKLFSDWNILNYALKELIKEKQE